MAAEAAAASAEAAAAEAQKEAKGKKLTELAQVAQTQREQIAKLEELLRAKEKEVEFKFDQGVAAGRSRQKATQERRNKMFREAKVVKQPGPQSGGKKRVVAGGYDTDDE